jgi:hypothetical protein
MCAPAMAWPPSSANFRVTVTGPTRTGCGEITVSILTEAEESGGLEQAAVYQIIRQAKPTAHFAVQCEERRDARCLSRFFRIAAPFARASRVSPLALGRKHMEVHSNRHGDKHDRIVEKMQFDARKHELQNAEGNWFAPKIVMRRRLEDQKEMFDVMPKLNPERRHPPGMGDSRKSFTENPQADQHHQCVAIVQGLGFDEPGIPQPKHSIRFGTGPVHDINLVRLDQVLGPVCQHDHHKYL